ncbi:MAG: type II secretion system F family protein [Galactobacter sp.]
MILAISGAALGLALTCLLLPMLPIRPKLSTAIADLTDEGIEATEADLLGTLTPRKQRLGSWAETRLGSVTALGVIPTKDLALLGRSTTAHYYTKLSTAVVLFVAGMVLSAFSGTLGLPFALPALAALVLAVLGWILPDSQVRTQAKRARTDYTRAIGAYVEIIATERKRNAAISDSLIRAARLSDSWIFQQIRHALIRAELVHQSPWTALENLGERVGVEVLGETARIVQLAGDDGAAVYESLRGQGQNMRRAALAEEQTRAHKITEQLSLMITALAGTFLALVMIPTMLTLMAS